MGSSITGTGRAELRIPAGRHAECRLECPGEVALVGEADLECRFCQRPRVTQPAPGQVEAPHHRIPVRAGAVDGMEPAGELVAVYASEPEWLGQHTLRPIVNQKGERQRQESR
jgi:hypothetical protein